MRRAAALIAVALALAAPTVAVAADCPRTTLGDVEDEVMCPVCGTPLELATDAPQAVQQREFIRRQVDRCASKEEIKRALVAQFGEEVLSLPGDQDDDGLEEALVYVVPALALLLAVGALALAVRRWRRRPHGGPTAVAPRSSDARLEADMDRYDL